MHARHPSELRSRHMLHSIYMAPSSILVIGAGELGCAVLFHLAHHPGREGTTVSALMRPSSINSKDPSKSKINAELQAMDVKLVPGDLQEDSIEQLAKTFGSYHTVISCSGMGAPPGTQTKVAKAALASGCRRYFPWQY